MRTKFFFRENYNLMPLIISGLICVFMVFILWYQSTTDPLLYIALEKVLPLIIAISGILAVAIMLYLLILVTSLKETRKSIVSDLNQYTQKMHHFRTIIDLLLHSKIWLPGLKSYIDEEYANLNYFEVKEFYKGYSKVAIEFLQENHLYQDTENLYLEFKAILITSPKEKIVPENIHYPKYYDKDIVEKWMEHKCGSGLWYYFGYKFATYKEALDLDAVYERHQDKILDLAHAIDSKYFEESSFNEVFLSRLGEYMNKQVIPKLDQLQTFAAKKLPASVNYIYFLFLGFVTFGVLLPVFYLLFPLHHLLLILTIAAPISLIIYVVSSFYHFLLSEVKV